MSHEDFYATGDPLGKFIEECGEALAAAGKTVRYGYESTNPLLPEDQRITNEEWLRREVADLRQAIYRLCMERHWFIQSLEELSPTCNLGNQGRRTEASE